MDNNRLITYSNPCPYENIAIEEALFLSSISTRIPVIRIWENINPCIYLGIGKRYKQEIFIQNCKKDKIPIIRRFSGGGTVFQEKGNLNYTIILPLEKYPNFKNINDSYKKIFYILSKIFSHKNIPLTFNGSSDFCIKNKKISGNAQARRKNTLLHHGTILIDINTKKMEKYLRNPKEIPEYRKKRNHSDFITSIKKEKFNVDHNFIKQKLIEFFPKHKNSCLSKQESLYTTKLLNTKYLTDKWNYKI